MDFVYSPYFYIPTTLILSAVGFFVFREVYSFYKYLNAPVGYSDLSYNDKKNSKKKKKKKKKKKVEYVSNDGFEDIQDNFTPAENERMLHSDLTFDDPKEKGDAFEYDCVNLLRDYGYDVYWRGLDLGVKDGGIDIVATKGNDMILIQCKNYKESSEITDKHLRIFYADINVYMNENDTTEYTVYPLFLTKHYQLAYNGKMWLDGKTITYFSFEDLNNHLAALQ